MHWGCYYATVIHTDLDIEVDLSGNAAAFGRRESDFALQRLVECLTLETERLCEKGGIWRNFPFPAKSQTK